MTQDNPPGQPKANWQNRTLFHGDNLKFLRAMNSESVDLIATDPPFKKGRDFHATPNSLASGAKFQDRWLWERDIHNEWVDQLKDDYPKLWAAIISACFTHSNEMGAYLCFMAVRLLEMHRILKSTGSIYLHCDFTASHYLKIVMDAIFGQKRFLNEIIWHYQSGGRSTTFYPHKYDSILFYSKTRKYTFNAEDIKIPRTKCPLCKTELQKWNNLRKQTDKDGRIFRTIRSNGKMYKYYDDEPVLPSNVWLEFHHLQQKDPERTGYPTQKPTILYERIIRASSNKDDIILDPFAGCATTLIAAERLERQWVGIDIWDNAIKAVEDRLSKENFMATESTNERLALYPVHYSKDLPERTDNGSNASPFLRVRVGVQEPRTENWTRAQMYEHLLEQNGPVCQGCRRRFDDKRYLELDHNTPRSDGGINHISNRILLCGPCNKLKSNQLTLSGLIRKNKKEGYWKG